MPLVNHTQHEIHLKVVYFGPHEAGKETNFEYIHAHTKGERSDLIESTLQGERVISFDLLPGGEFKGYRVRLHLCTAPGQMSEDRVRRLLLRHADGVVLVVDSQTAELHRSFESMANLVEDLRHQGDDLTAIPFVVQYNKRDAPGVLDVADLHEYLSVPPAVPEIEAVASRGDGVFETMKAVVKVCLKSMGHPEHAREGRTPSVIPSKPPSAFPPAANAQLTGAAKLPAPPLLPF